MTYVACDSKLRSVVRFSMHPCQGNWMAIRRAVVNYTRAAHAFGAGIESRHKKLKQNTYQVHINM